MNLAVVSLFAFIHYTTVAADTTSSQKNHLKTIRLESTPQPLTLSNFENTDITPFMVNAPKTPKGPRGPSDLISGETNEHVTLAGSGIGKIPFAAVLCLDVKIYGNENEQGSAGTNK